MNNYFVNVTESLDTPEIMIEQLPTNTDIVYIDPIDIILHNYKNHPSILKIMENVKPTETFSFNKID